MENYIRRIFVGSLLMTLIMNALFSQQYGWRGPGRTGIYNEKGLMKSWPSTGPILLWETTGIGKGYSSANSN